MVCFGHCPTRTSQAAWFIMPSIVTRCQKVEYTKLMIKYLKRIWSTVTNSLKKCSNSLKKNPTFKVDKTACDIFDSWQHKQSVVYQAKLAYSLYETAQGAYNSLLRSSDHAYSNAHKISQYDAYSLLAGHNFGTLKAKSVNGEPLTVQETAYLESWFSAENIRFAAMGVYCAVKGDLGHLAQVEKNIK